MAFPTGWNWKAPITIDADEVDGALTDFPVLLTEACLPSEMFDADGSHPAQNGGGDLRFSSDAAGATQLPCEVVSFVTDNNPASGSAQIHVKVPSVSASVDTTIYVWWNTSGTDSQPSASDTYGSENVWDSNFQAVYHLEEDPSGSAPQVLDSTSNDRHGTSAGSMTGGDSITAGVGSGLDLEGADDTINRSPAAVTGYPLTLELLAKPDVATGSLVLLSVLTDSTANWNGHYLNIDTKLQAVSVATTPFRVAASTGNVATGQWQHMAGVFTSSTNRQAFLNGVGGTANTGASAPTGMNNTTIGSSKRSTQDFYFNGGVDEVRVSSAARSAAWVAATHSTLLTPGTFASAGTPEFAGLEIGRLINGGLVNAGLVNRGLCS